MIKFYGPGITKPFNPEKNSILSNSFWLNIKIWEEEYKIKVRRKDKEKDRKKMEKHETLFHKYK